MFFTQIQFPFDSADEDDEARDIVSSILGSMCNNGQISSSEYPVLESPQGFTSFMLIPAEDALLQKYNNEWVEKEISRFVKAGGKQPEFIIIGRDAESCDVCQCAEPCGYVLFTTFISMESPLRCAACFGPVPLYRVPPTHEGEYWDLRGWKADYQACDTLQMHCTVLERATMRQMARLDSPLTQEGLKICRLISAITNQPVYYYLYRHNGRSIASEEKRKCPNCGGEWRLEESWHRKFDFKCDNCHLLSNIAFNVC